MNVNIFVVVVIGAATSIGRAQDDMSVTSQHTIGEAVVERSLAEVWWLFTTSEGLRRWMTPDTQIDLRIDGELRSSKDTDGNLHDRSTKVYRILSYSPGRMISLQNIQAPDGFAHMDLLQQTWSVVTFEPADSHRTAIRIKMVNCGEGGAWDELIRVAEHDTQRMLSRLEEVSSDRSSSDPAANIPSPDIQCEVTIAAPLDVVWRAWTTEAGLAEFLAPQSSVDLRISGPYELYFDPTAQPGQRGSEGCRILAFEPNRMLSFSWNAPPNFPFARNHLTWVVLEFSETDDQSVQVRLTQLGFDELKHAHPDHAEEFEQSRVYFERIWPHVLNSLREQIER